MTQQLDRTLDGFGSFRCDLRLPEPVFRFSPGACAINGLRADVAHSMLDVLQIQHPEDRARVILGIEQAQQIGRVVVPHRIHRAGDRTVRDLVATICVERDGQGRPRGVAGMFADVTEGLAVGAGIGTRLVQLGATAVLCVAGGVDMTSRSAFAGALHNAMAGSRGDLYLDFARMRFIDLHGVEVVVEAAHGLAPDRRLVCVEPPRNLRTVIEFLRQRGVVIPPTLVVPELRVQA